MGSSPCTTTEMFKLLIMSSEIKYGEPMMTSSTYWWKPKR